MADRYWVNRSGGTGALGSGTGNWNDSNNWSATSGGTGGAGVPTSSDNVLFDNSSAGDCTLDTTPTLVDWTMTSGYSGATLGLGIYTVTCTGDVSIASNDDLLDAGSSTVDMAGSSTQTLGNPNLSNAFYNLDISQDVDLDDDVYVHDGVLTIDSGHVLDLHAVSGTGHDVHLRGSGNVLVLNGWFNASNGSNLGTVYFELDVDDTVLNVPGGTGFGSNGSYTAAALRCRLVGAITGTFSLQGDIANVDNLAVWGDSSSGDPTFNTNDYDITTYSFMLWGDSETSSDAPLTCNFGSSSITCPLFVRWVSNNGATYNLQTSTWSVSQWSPYPTGTGAVTVAPTFNVGASSVTVTDSVGENWQNDDDFIKFYDLTFSPSGASSTGDVKFSVENTITFAAGKSHDLQRQVTGGSLEGDASTGDIGLTLSASFPYEFSGMDFTGTDPYEVSVSSDTPGTPWSGTMTGYGRVDHTAVSDSEVVGEEIDALDPSNTDGGNNGPSWVFDDNQQAIVIS